MSADFLKGREDLLFGRVWAFLYSSRDMSVRPHFPKFGGMDTSEDGTMAFRFFPQFSRFLTSVLAIPFTKYYTQIAFGIEKNKW